jgi:autotransporter passenger strand-loop-strand repeat protein
VLGTVTSNATISAGGLETVSAGGVISGAPNSGTVVFGTLNVLSGGRAAFFSVKSGGNAVVSSGASANNYTVSGGGTFNVLGTVTSGSILASGVENVSSGRGFLNGALFTTVSSGGELVISSGGFASATVISSGGLDIVLGSDSNDTVSSGGVEIISSGGTALQY